MTTKKITLANIDSILPPYELPLLAAVSEMGREMMETAGEEDPDTNPLEYYGEWYMESLSEAGYSETRPNDRLSERAFGHLLRVKADDQAQVKNVLGWRKGSVYHDFALCDTVIDVLSRSADLAPALPRLAPDADCETEGPFYPDCCELSLTDALATLAAPKPGLIPDYLSEIIRQHRLATEEGKAVVKLAGLFRVNKTELVSLARQLQCAGAASDEGLQLALAYVVLDCVRTSLRLTAGLRGAVRKCK